MEPFKELIQAIYGTPLLDIPNPNERLLQDPDSTPSPTETKTKNTETETRAHAQTRTRTEGTPFLIRRTSFIAETRNGDDKLSESNSFLHIELSENNEDQEGKPNDNTHKRFLTLQRPTPGFPFVPVRKQRENAVNKLVSKKQQKTIEKETATLSKHLASRSQEESNNENANNDMTLLVTFPDRRPLDVREKQKQQKLKKNQRERNQNNHSAVVEDDSSSVSTTSESESDDDMIRTRFLRARNQKPMVSAASKRALVSQNSKIALPSSSSSSWSLVQEEGIFTAISNHEKTKGEKQRNEQRKNTLAGFKERHKRQAGLVTEEQQNNSSSSATHQNYHRHHQSRVFAATEEEGEAEREIQRRKRELNKAMDDLILEF